jgi:uncharacterized heparinase superfamily protein
MSAARPIDAGALDAGRVEPGKQLIRLDGDKGQSLAEKLSAQFHRLAWRTPLHSFRLRGRYPLKLIGVPVDPIPGDARAGQAMLAGQLPFRSEAIELESLDFTNLGVSPAFADYLQSFAWLRDLAAAGPRERVAPIAELIVRQWIGVHGAHVTQAAWRPDLWGRRILFWGSYAPLILSSSDIVYRSAVLNGLARGARHLDRVADKAQQGLPRITAWTGLVAAGLLIPAGEARRAQAEAGLARALAVSLHEDGGLANRSPSAQLELVELLSQLRAVYAIKRLDPPEPIQQALARAVPALLGVTLGDGALSSWQGSGPISSERVDAAVDASGIRTRPLRQARDWGYQRLSCGQTRMVIDAAPPPVTRLAAGGCASTLAFELSDGPHRLVVNCGGAGSNGTLPADLAEALRTTAAHSTLTLDDSNSTAIHKDGSLGRGVIQVELDRQEIDSGSRLEVSHDGYVRRHGFLHQRQFLLSGDGRELRGEDILLPSGRRRGRVAGFTVRFHLAPGIEVSGTADGQGALLRLAQGALWQFRCRGGTLEVEDSLWIDAMGRPCATQQLAVSGQAAPGGATVSWLLKRAG